MADPNDQHNQAGLLAFLFSFSFVLVFFVYIVFIHPGVDLHENIKDPVAAGTQAAADADVDVSKVTEPWVASADMVQHGKKVFQMNCTMCHGPEGRGDGPAGASLNPKPRNLVEGPWKKGGGFIGIFTVLQEGLPGGGMASYKQMKTVDRWALTQYVNSITNAKVKEDAAKVAAFGKTAQ
jgi:mono/diheme cytochrome c family protein